MENNYKGQTQKIVLGTKWYNLLINAIKYNSDLIKDLSVESKMICDRNDRLMDKLSKYQKRDEQNGIYYYFYQRELKDLFWVLLENFSNICN